MKLLEQFQNKARHFEAGVDSYWGDRQSVTHCTTDGFITISSGSDHIEWELNQIPALRRYLDQVEEFVGLNADMRDDVIRDVVSEMEAVQ